MILADIGNVSVDMEKVNELAKYEAGLGKVLYRSLLRPVPAAPADIPAPGRRLQARGFCGNLAHQ